MILFSIFSILVSTPLRYEDAKARYSMVSSIVSYQTVLLLPKDGYYVGFTQIGVSLEDTKDFFVDFSGDSVFDLRVNGNIVEVADFNLLKDSAGETITIPSHVNGKKR